jgi:hypothetical protein
MSANTDSGDQFGASVGIFFLNDKNCEPISRHLVSVPSIRSALNPLRAAA